VVSVTRYPMSKVSTTRPNEVTKAENAVVGPVRNARAGCVVLALGRLPCTCVCCRHGVGSDACCVCMFGLGGWVAGWMGGWLTAWMDGWMDGWMRTWMVTERESEVPRWELEPPDLVLSCTWHGKGRPSYLHPADHLGWHHRMVRFARL